ncbi:hypothetical protein FSP39_003441 [Pinctada imbricata]|uniref:Inosine/uridine-preferring nucleoside hydrolase domain-containing protein n=1 Tax=Pinctada imbricata TaxID=66713 RepID=A0AA89BQ92_PINIB|nr:hypothetical protein FSP39_003441 [Pinctada imbricata]
MTSERKICVFDTDAGTDDAQAMSLALASPSVDVVGVTTVSGNTDAKQAAINVLRLLQLTDRQEVPVFCGSTTSLLGNEITSSGYHGWDGLGDVPNREPIDEQLIKEESVTDALIRLSKEYEGKLTVIAIGPLTNIAKAIFKDKEFGRRLKDCYIMGGNYHGMGNTSTICAEFNFHCDPEAANIVLNQLGCPITLVGNEVCANNTLSWDQHKELRSINTKVGAFFAEMEKEVAKKWNAYFTWDEYAVASFLNPNGIIKDSHTRYATVELKGEYTRGMVAVDWRGTLKREANVSIITDVDSGVLFQMIKEAMHLK